MDIQNIVCGYIPSQLDGTEYQSDFGDFDIPVEFTYRPLMPPVRDQGTESTCVCQTLTGMLDVQRNAKNDVTNVCNNFSIQELYNQRSNKPQEGMIIKEALSILRHKGLNDEKIANYAMCTSVKTAKQAIVANGPLAIGMMVYNNGSDRYWISKGMCVGGHCTMLVGYDENGFIMRNSWGLSYGNEGYITLPYSDFEEYCMECWTITL
jgi:hypothetical protein